MHSFITSQLALPDSIDTLNIHPNPSIGIEDIRALQVFLSKKPQRSDHNTVVINAAHLLTLPAQHALLKTLEEPPGKSLIYLVTPNYHSLLPTILSRCELINTPSDLPAINLVYSALFQKLISAHTVGERFTLLDSQPLTREQALEFLDTIELILHQQINSGLLSTINYQLITDTRRYLKANCSLKLCLDNLAINLVK